jgi:hypothetical protein
VNSFFYKNKMNMQIVQRNLILIFFTCLLMASCGSGGESATEGVETREQMDSMVEALETAANMDSILATQGEANEMPDSTESGEMEEDTMYNTAAPIDVKVN